MTTTDSPFWLSDNPSPAERLAAAAFADADLPERMAHSRGVARAVTRLLAEHPTTPEQAETLRRAAWLHDIGYAYPDTGMHAVDGAAWLAAQGESWLDELVPHVGWHSTARWECVARGMGLPQVGEPGVYPHSMLWVADFSTSPVGLPVTVWERVGEIRDRYAPGSVVVRALDEAMPSLHRALRVVRAGCVVA